MSAPIGHHGGMSIGMRSSVAVVLVTLALAACGTDSDAGGTGTDLSIEGVATTGFAAPDPNDPTGAVADPDAAIEIDISGDITCAGAKSSGTGAYEASAPDICLQLAGQRGTLESLSNVNPDDLVCSEIYGGPQQASITGRVDGVSVDIDVDRKNGCGIDTWQQLEWLLGPPER